MTQVWQDENAIPVTVIKISPNQVSLLRDSDRHGYRAVQLSAPNGRRRLLKEFRVDDSSELKVGDIIDVSAFTIGDRVKITGVSRGLGFQGVVKRHGFAGAPKTHGTKDQLRASGSIGAGGVQRVFKGTRMGGRAGGENVTVKNLVIVGINPEAGELLVRGAVPGHRGSWLKVVKL